MKILFYGDIVGKIGRKALAKAVPVMREQYQPDVVIANAENIAHGKSITHTTFGEVMSAGVDFCTSGNHILSKPEAAEILSAPDPSVIRPANFPPGSPGVGWRVLPVGGKSLLVINLIGQVFMKEGQLYGNPFQALDQLLELQGGVTPFILVDFHGEVTSEKEAFGWHAAGRVSAVVGTHTHVPTADARILPGGTAYVTDIGKVGAAESVIGMSKEPIVQGFIEGRDKTVPAGIPEHGPCTVNAVLIELDEAGRAVSIERVDRLVEV